MEQENSKDQPNMEKKRGMGQQQQRRQRENKTSEKGNPDSGGGPKAGGGGKKSGMSASDRMKDKWAESEEKLDRHYKQGNQKDFTGHPNCGFCNLWYYDKDALYEHCRNKHEQCFICLQNNVDRYVYYRDYRDLLDHFEDKHYPCRYPECLEQKFVVFGNEIDYKSHEREVHGQNIVGQKAKWESKKINIDISYNQQRAEEQGGASRSKNRDKNVRADDESNQRGRSNGRGKGNELAMRRKPEGFGMLSEPASSNTPIEEVSEEELRAHSEVMDYIISVTENNQGEIALFKKFTAELKNNEISCQDYIDNLEEAIIHGNENNNERFNIMSQLVKKLLNLSFDEQTKDGLREALNNSKIKKNQFPALMPLPGISSAANSKKPAIVAFSNIVARQQTGKGTNRNIKSVKVSQFNSPLPSSAAVVATSGTNLGSRGLGREEEFPSLAPSTSKSAVLDFGKGKPKLLSKGGVNGSKNQSQNQSQSVSSTKKSKPKNKPQYTQIVAPPPKSSPKPKPSVSAKTTTQTTTRVDGSTGSGNTNANTSKQSTLPSKAQWMQPSSSQPVPKQTRNAEEFPALSRPSSSRANNSSTSKTDSSKKPASANRVLRLV
ncbi:E3 ubiquitin-protein ligase hel2 [Zancudomyces culisetae]|uniref:E3 ubiquitin-protein ligase hel2 n=1 Tax=Zancudomyces culisetae TaxID=1213189 RepID=A0A1R1PBU7_ZANCU|nr:E3 ubiquitin-protein ligase hel2 [Zancudomyces culisetae]|eukprot:OMH78455.1 E3 ubiquitin-protein ligase hel2 [Zancudomyces culisetae]